MQQTLKILILIAIVLLIPIVPYLVIGELPGERWLSATDDRALAFAVTGGGLLTLDVVLPVPSSIVIALLGGRLGFFPGWICAWLGLTAGNLIGYGIGRLWPQKLALDISESPTFIMLILSRPVPILAEAVTIAAGAMRTRLIHVFAACAAGNLVYAGALAANGSALLAVEWTGPGIFLALFVPVICWFLWRWWLKKSSKGAAA